MDLFEEALRRWEEALTFRSRQTDDDASCASIKTGAGDTVSEEGMEVNTENLLMDIQYFCSTGQQKVNTNSSR